MTTVIGKRNPVPKKWVPLFRLCMNVVGVVIGIIWIMTVVVIVLLILES
jgi:cytoskeletal protein RodZ